MNPAIECEWRPRPYPHVSCGWVGTVLTCTADKALAMVFIRLAMEAGRP